MHICIHNQWMYGLNRYIYIYTQTNCEDFRFWEGWPYTSYGTELFSITNHPFFIINHPFGGTPIYGNPYDWLLRNDTVILSSFEDGCKQQRRASSGMDDEIWWMIDGMARRNAGFVWRTLWQSRMAIEHPGTRWGFLTGNINETFLKFQGSQFQLTRR